MNINVKRYFDAISCDQDLKRYRTLITKPFGKFLFRLNDNLRMFLICGIIRKGKEHRLVWNDNYHLLSKLCRYEAWEDVKITWWDRIRYRIITGYKFE